MAYPNIFNPETTTVLVQRIEQLKPDTTPQWGKMSVTEMLAHCSLAYEYNNGMRQTKIPGIMKFLLKGMMRKAIVGEAPYKQNSPTASYFKVTETEAFEKEKQRLISNVRAYQEQGETKATQLEHAWLGKLSAEDWSIVMYKHIDHHLRQFGV